MSIGGAGAAWGDGGGGAANPLAPAPRPCGAAENNEARPLGRALAQEEILLSYAGAYLS